MRGYVRGRHLVLQGAADGRGKGGKNGVGGTVK